VLDTDGFKQSIQEIVTVHKKFYLCFQKKDWALDEYTRKFTARQEVCKQLGFSPRQSLYTARMAASEDGEDYNALSEGNDDEHTKAQKYIKKGMEYYMTALYFEGLK
jgi:hypothetical protein